jgi:hypothetical protein
MRRLTLLLALLALAGLAPAAALGSRPANAPEAEFIIEAIETSRVGGIDRIPLSWYQVERIRISSVNQRYASAFLDATPRARARLQPTDVLLEQVRGTWRVLDLDQIPCGIAPRRVLRDLFGGCVPSGPRILSFRVPRHVVCTGAQTEVRVRWRTRAAAGISFAVDGQPLSAAAGFPPSGAGNVPVPCDGSTHDIELWAFGSARTQAGPARRLVTTLPRS